MEKLTIYQVPTCTTCRKVIKTLEEAGVDFEAIDYYINPIPKSKLKDLLKKMGLRARDILRKEVISQELRLIIQKYSDDDLIELMVDYPDLIQRPIVEKGKKAILARPPERIKEIL